MALLENETSSNESAIECVSKREKPAFKAKKTFGMVPVLGELCVLSFSRGGWTKKNAQVESELQSSFLLLFVANRIICINE